MSDELKKELEKDTYVITNINDTVYGKRTTGQKLADAVAKFGGSWGFIISFAVILVVWMTINVVHLFGIQFDPYPFILLNLFLSCVAAIQAPIIMMSQNRQAERDRFDSENDYKTNMKSEMEIRILHEKLDQLNEVQWPHILDIQKMQIEVLSEIENEIQSLKSNNENKNNRNTRHPSR
jgi:Predicted membrane protein